MPKLTPGCYPQLRFACESASLSLTEVNAFLLSLQDQALLWSPGLQRSPRIPPPETELPTERLPCRSAAERPADVSCSFRIKSKLLGIACKTLSVVRTAAHLGSCCFYSPPAVPSPGYRSVSQPAFLSGSAAAFSGVPSGSPQAGSKSFLCLTCPHQSTRDHLSCGPTW